MVRVNTLMIVRFVCVCVILMQEFIIIIIVVTIKSNGIGNDEELRKQTKLKWVKI